MRRREQILVGAALVALVLGLGLGHVLARATGGDIDAGLAAAGQLELAAGVTTSSPEGSTVSTSADGAAATSVSAPSTVAPAAAGSDGATTPAAAPTVVTAPSTTAAPAPASSTTATTRAPVPTATATPSSTRAPATTATSPPPAAGLNRMEQGVLDAVNAARQLAGCQPLAVDASLQAAAHAYAAFMVDQHWFDHRSPDGQSPTDRARAAGYQGGVGENLMMGFKDDPAGAVNNPQYGWLHSEGHRANILNCDYRRTGVGYDPGNIQAGYADGAWVQMFG